MKELIFLALFMVALAMPVVATEVDGGSVDGVAAVSDPTTVIDSGDSGIETDLSETTVETAENEENISALAADSDLSGGYYFVCDCDLGYDMKFYVPLEWAHNVFALDGSGAPVNMSTSTCYLYCPAYPDYTFSASRFGTFTYRASNYNTTDLEIRNINDTNITFIEDESNRLSDSEVLLMIACMIFMFGGIGLVRWR